MKAPIFILGSGRSGSTLVQRLLNSYPDVTIWGEHGGFLKHTADAFFRLLEHRGNNQFVFANSSVSQTMPWSQVTEHKKPEHWQAWLNSFSREDVTTFFRTHLEAFFRHPSMPADHRWGFKEIRYGNQDRVVEFLSRLYPDAHFIFLVRNAFNTLASQGRAFGCRTRLGSILPHHAFRQECLAWRAQNESLWAWHISGRLRSFWFSYEDFSCRLASLGPLLTSLGKQIGPRQQEVLDMPEGRGSAFDSSDLDRWRSQGFLQLCWAELAIGNLNEALGYKSPKRVAWLKPLRRAVGRVFGKGARMDRFAVERPPNGHTALAGSRES
jgi:hypothetical protein